MSYVKPINNFFLLSFHDGWIYTKWWKWPNSDIHLGIANAGRRRESVLLHMWKWIGYDWDICQFQSKQRDGVCPGTVSRGIIENTDCCFIRRGFKKGFYLLRLQMLIVSFCSTSIPVPYRLYDKHTHAVWHDMTFPELYNRPVSFSSRCTWSVFHTNQSTDQSEEQQFHSRNILHVDVTHVH